MKLETDDTIHRFEGRWISARGTPMPIVARYTAWGIFACSVIPLAAIGRITRMPLGFFLCFVIGGAALLGKVLADYLNGEYTVGSWIGILAGNYVALRRHRRERRAWHTRTYRIHQTPQDAPPPRNKRRFR